MPTFSLDHVQLAIPVDSEERADAFYVDRLGFSSVAKPASLSMRGGRWYESGAVHVHLGADPAFASSAKAHVAFRVKEFDELFASLEAHGERVQKDDDLPGVDRFYVWDPFGNRLDMMRAIS